MLEYQHYISVARPKNVVTVFKALKDLNVSMIEIEYFTLENEGIAEIIAIDPVSAKGEILLRKVTWLSPQFVNDNNGRSIRLQETNITLEEALKLFVLNRITQLCPEWEDTDAKGVMKIDVNKGQYSIEHPD